MNSQRRNTCRFQTLEREQSELVRQHKSCNQDHQKTREEEAEAEVDDDKEEEEEGRYAKEEKMKRAFGI